MGWDSGMPSLCVAGWAGFSLVPVEPCSQKRCLDGIKIFITSKLNQKFFFDNWHYYGQFCPNIKTKKGRKKMNKKWYSAEVEASLVRHVTEVVILI